MRLNAKLFKEYKKYPERVLQFGEGNFLRAFSNWIMQEMNERGIFNGSAVVIQPIASGLVDVLNEQDGLYTLFLQGIKDGEVKNEHKIINSISRGINPYSNYDEYLEVAKSSDIRFAISNTTEAGIAFDETDELNKVPHSSFPAKLTAFMYRRFKHFNGASEKGLIVIPCELIDRNGEKLKEAVLKYAELWKLEDEFIQWIEENNVFCCTLVDRIVPGYPRENIGEIGAELGYEDKLVDVGEQFHLWVIEAPKWVQEEFPAESIGLNVKFVDDMTPYRERKVRILNGAHTAMVPVAYLYGIDTVRESVEHQIVGGFVQAVLQEEIIPTLNLPREELKAFASDVIDRFKNPFIKHNLMSIALNSMSKFETRVLPSLLEYIERYGRPPLRLTFSLASYIKFYSGFRGEETINLADDEDTLALYKELWSKYDGSFEGINIIVKEVLSCKRIWKMNLNNVPLLTQTVSEHLYAIERKGLSEALKELL